MECLVGWQPLPTNSFKINVDGEVGRVQDHGSCEGILRNDRGDFLGGFALNIGRCLLMETELCGIYHDLKLARETGIRQLIVEFDFLNAIKLIKLDIQEENPLFFND